MPSRKKASAQDTKAALNLSFREYGGKLTGADPHTAFYRKITTQAVTQALAKHDQTTIQMKEIPQDREEAIQMVFTLDLYGYLDNNMFALKSKYAHDKLETILKFCDDPAKILGWAPFYFRNDKRGPFTKWPFKSFELSRLDPLKRFTLIRESLSPHDLALQDCGNDEGWLNGFAFEALLASHAAWSQKCFRCRSEGLRYCGGADTSWRDLICAQCHSCYEIKSKKDKQTIDNIVKFDGLNAGSFKAWCAEDFSDRTIGADFLVLVNRTPCQDGSGWAVYIAEIGTVLPALCDMSFAQAQNNEVPIKTRVTMKNKPQRWFKIPGGDLSLLDFRRIFQKSYKEVFPGKSCKLSVQVDQERTSVPPPVNHRPAPDIEEIRALFSGFSTRDNWEDDDSD